MRRRGSPVVAERRARGRRDKAATRGLWPDDPDSPRLKRSTASSQWEAAPRGAPRAWPHVRGRRHRPPAPLGLAAVRAKPSARPDTASAVSSPRHPPLTP